MATIEVITTYKAEPVLQRDLVPETLYFTAEGLPAYAATKTFVVLFNDPSANSLLVNDHSENNVAIMRRFPFTRAPDGTKVVISQQPLVTATPTEN